MVVSPHAPGFTRAFGRVVVSGYRLGRTVPLPGALVRPYLPGTNTPYTDPLYLDEAATTPATFPAMTDWSGALMLWSDAPARVELECAAAGFATQRLVADLEIPPDYEDPFPQYLTVPEAEALFVQLSHLTDADPHPQYATDADLIAHEGAADPHPVYLTGPEASGLFVPASHTDEALEPDPHPVYVTVPEGDERWAQIAGGAFTNPFPLPMVFEDSLEGATITQSGKTVLDTDHLAAADPHPVYFTDADAATLIARVAALEAQVATLQAQMTGHTHTSGTVDAMGGPVILP